MSTLHRLATVCILGAAVAAFISGCSSDSDSGTPSGHAGAGTAGSGAAGAGTAGAGTAGSGTAGSGTAGAPSGDATKGKTAYSGPQATCNLCHGANGEGQVGPNITGSTTAGIGTWTYAEFSNQIRTSTKKDGTKNCATAGMPMYTTTDLSDADVADIYAYLISVKNETANKGTACP